MFMITPAPAPNMLDGDVLREDLAAAGLTVTMDELIYTPADDDSNTPDVASLTFTSLDPDSDAARTAVAVVAAHAGPRPAMQHLSTLASPAAVEARVAALEVRVGKVEKGVKP